MQALYIDRADDPRLAAYALLGDPARLRREGWFVAEGRLVVERLLLESRFEIASLLLNDSAWRALEPRLREGSVTAPVYLCPASLFARLTGHDFHRGCLALVRRPAPVPVSRVIETARVLVVLERVANADNVGSVFRNVAAFGADAVLLDPRSGDPLYRKTIRTSMGASLRVPFASWGDAEGWPEPLSWLHRQGFELLALTPAAGALDIDAFAARPGRAARFALLLGAEGDGLSEAAFACAQHRLRIAIRPAVDSLNLAVACGIALQRLMPRS
ncbi:MAG TPA: RNA methyltransferase [Polyangiaceae bacterium]|nr:RNA methyltransferase [Polyangiaceae bacterium]